MPEEVTSVGRILQFPPFPDVPEPLRGGKFVVVEAAVIGDERGRGAAATAPRARPRDGHLRDGAAGGIAELHMDPRSPCRTRARG